MDAFKKEMKKIVSYFQTGVSYMIPVVTAAGLMTSIAVIFGGTGVWSETSTIWGNIRMIGQTGLQFIVPMIAAYIAFAVADRPGLAPGFIVGTVAQQMGTGFLGGMLVGVLVGYLAKWLKKIPMPANLQAVKTIIIIPLTTTLVIGLLLVYVVGTPIQAMTDGLTAWLKGMSGTNTVILAGILGAMMAIDMGGPINKIANTFGLAAFASGAYAASTAMLLAISIPPLGMFVSTLLGGKKVYSEEELDSGRSALVMGIVGITEGTIPFAVADPIRVIPSIIAGTCTATMMNAAFGVTQPTALSTVLSIPFSSNAILYVISILAGTAVTAILVTVLKKYTKKSVAKVKEN